MSRALVVSCVVPICAGWGVWSASAAPLSDGALFFDPYTMVEGFYPTHTVPLGGSLVFNSSPGRTIIGANIMPLLADNNYGPYGSYTFSQADYAFQPNQPGGYFADLTDGTLTATFEADSPYHVRVNYSDGSNDMHTVFITGGLGGDPHSGQDQANRASPWRQVPGKMADLYIVSTGPANDGFINAAVAMLDPMGQAGMPGSNVGRAANMEDVLREIMRRKNEVSDGIDPIKVAIIGHGFPGSIRLGHGANAVRINNSGNPNTISGTDFGMMIRDCVSMVNLFGCDTGGQAAGGTLLQDITNTGVMAQAYTSTVGLTNTGWFAYTWGTKVPSPGSLALLALAGIAATRRRR